MIDESMSPGDAEADNRADEDNSGGVAGFLRETAIVVGLSLIIATIVRIFFVQAFLIPSESMEDTLLVGDRVIVSKISMRFDDVHRGDVVVFEDPDDKWLGPQVDDGDGGAGDAVKSFFEFVGVLPDDSEGHLIKRVIGVGGDQVKCCDANDRITVNGTPIDESDYLPPGTEPSDTDFNEKVPDGHLWVMGDNRSNSGDSRVQEGAEKFVDEDLVVGRAFATVWPISRWDGLGRPDAFDKVPAGR